MRVGGYLALLLAAQTEKDLPRGFGYLDHAFLGSLAALRAGFFLNAGSVARWRSYLPQHVRRAAAEGRLLGQVRRSPILRKASPVREITAASVLLYVRPSGLRKCKNDCKNTPDSHDLLVPLWQIAASNATAILC